jgi:hypothetical protein
MASREFGCDGDARGQRGAMALWRPSDERVKLAG